MLSRLVPFLKKAVASNTPIFGICCGGQILAILLGGAVERLPRMEIGFVALQLTQDGRYSKLLAGFPDTVPAFEWHADVFVPPPGARTLIGGGAWHAQAYESGLNVGVLFHLEYGIDLIGRWADAYADELAPMSLRPRDVVDACAPHAGTMVTLGRRLMANYLNLIRAR
jgi:GMP synthase-like glutamine amidotransferase